MGTVQVWQHISSKDDVCGFRLNASDAEVFDSIALSCNRSQKFELSKKPHLLGASLQMAGSLLLVSENSCNGSGLKQLNFDSC